MAKKKRALIPAEQQVDRRPFHGEIRWTVDREAWGKGEVTAFQPRDGKLYLYDRDTGAQQDIHIGPEPEPVTPTGPEPEGEFIDAEYHDAT